jgi:hypothetical protein
MYSFKSRCLSHFAAVELFIRPDAPWAAQAVGAQLIEALPRDSQYIYSAGSNSKYLTPLLPRRATGNNPSSCAESSIKEATRSSPASRPWHRGGREVFQLQVWVEAGVIVQKGLDRVRFAWFTAYDMLSVLSKLTSPTHHQTQIEAARQGSPSG